MLSTSLTTASPRFRATSFSCNMSQAYISQNKIIKFK